MSDLNTEIKIGADASGVEAGVGKAKRSLKDLGDAAQKAGKDAGAGIGSIGAVGDKAAKDVERATKNMQGSLQRLLAEQKAGAKGSREYYEALADTRGISRSAIKPILDQIDAAKSKTLQAKDAAESWTASLGKVGPLVAAAFSGAAITGFLGKVVSVQREFDVLNSSLKTVTGSSAAAEREMAWLKDFAKETPFGLAQATQGFVKMKALGLDPTRAALTSFGNTASAMGKDLNQMIEAVADASTGEFERLKEFGIKAKKEGDNVSLTFQGVTKTIGNSAREITQYLEDIGNTSFGGAMEERAKTLDGTIAALGDTWDELFRTVSTNNVGGLIFDSVTLANGVLEDATTIIRAMGGAVGETSREFGSLSAIQGGVATFFETVSVLAANTLYVLRQTGDTMAGVAAGYKAFFSFDFDAVRAIGAEMKANGEAARKEIDATTARILNARKEQEEYARYATRNASAATDPRRVDLGGSAPLATSGVSSGTAKAVKETISEYDKLIKKLSDELPKAAAEAEAAQMGYNKAQTEFLALAGSPAWASFSNSQRAVVASMFEGKIASEQAGEAAKELSKAYAEAAAERIKTIQSMERAADSLQSQNDALRDEIELIGLSTEQQTLVLQQRNDVIILTKEATLAELERQSAITGTQTRVEIALASEIDALKERNALLGAKGVKNAAVDAAKSAADEWQKTTDSINQSLTDSLMRGFESGKDFAKNLRDTVINMFNTMVLRPVISAIVNPVAGAVTSALGLPGAQGGGNSVMGGIQTASNLNSLYGAGSQALFGGAAGASAASLGYANAIGMAGGDAIGALATANGMWAGVATGAQAAAQSAIAANAAMAAGEGVALAAGTNAAAAGAGAAGAAGSSLGSMAAAAGPWVAAAIAIYAIAKSLDDSGTYHTGGAAQYSAATGLRTSLGFRDNEEGLPSYNPNDNIDNQFGTGFGYVERGDQTISAVSGIAQALGTALDGVAVSFGQKAGYEIATAFADDTSKDGAWGALRISKDGQELLNWEDNRQSKWAPREFGDGEEGYKQYLAAVAKDTRQVLLDMDLPSWADTMLESIGDAASMDQLAATVQQIGAIQTTFVQLGKAMEGFAGLTDQAFEALVRASGGFESLAANAGTYYENFYSEAEKTAAVTRSVSDALAQVGVAMPATRDEFRALVESQLALGEAGAEAVAALLGVSGAFASVVPAAASVVPAAEEASTAIGEILSEAMKRLQSDTASLQIDLLRAQGNTTGANAAQRTLDTTGLIDAEIAVYDYNQSLREQIEVANAAQAAAQAQADILQSLIGQQAGLWADLAAAQGDNALAAQRRYWIETDGMTAAQIAAYDYNQTIRDQITAANSAAEAMQRANSALSGLGGTRFDLENQLYSLQGMDDAVLQRTRERDLASLTEGLDAESAAKITAAYDYNNTLRQQIKAQQDLNAAAQAAAQAQAQAASDAQRAADQVKSAWQSITDSIVDEAMRIRGLITGDSAMGFAQSQSAFAIATAQARAGDQDAAKLLPELSRTMLELAKNSVATLTELQVYRAQTSGSLEETARLLAAQFGVTLPSLAVGTNYLPRDMLIQAHQGERIIPAADNRMLIQAMQGNGNGNGSAAVVVAVQQLSAQIEKLDARLAAIEASNDQMASQQDDATEGGNAMRAEIMNVKALAQAIKEAAV